MARRKEPPAPDVASRPFTQAELARIRMLTARMEPWGPQRSRQVVELEAIHAAAGRRRGFMLWDWDPPHDPDRAFEEELSGGLLPRSS